MSVQSFLGWQLAAALDEATVAAWAGTATKKHSEATGFSFQARKNGDVVIHHRERLAATLCGAAADRFLLQAETLPLEALQQRMARLTGNCKR